MQEANQPVPGRPHRLHLTWSAGLVLAFALGFGLGLLLAPRRESPDTAKDQVDSTLARCVKILDGDTVRVEWQGRLEDLRFLGIDCPETKHSRKLLEQAQKLHVPQEILLRYGEIAKKTTESWLLNRDLHIIFPSDRVQRDAFGRLLAYVEEQGVDIGGRLLLGGNASIMTVDVHPRVETYELLQAEAQKDGKGIWRRD